jgi:hypothetical protein
MCFRVIVVGGMDWIDLAQDRDQWRALVSTVMTIQVPSNGGAHLVAVQEGLSSMKLGTYFICITFLYWSVCCWHLFSFFV